MVNAAYDAIHAVKRDNVVIAGGTSPFGNDDAIIDEISPLLFMRKLLLPVEGSKAEGGMQDACPLRCLGSPSVHLRRADAPWRRTPTMSRRPTSGR